MLIFSGTNLLKEEVDQFQILEKVFSNNLGVLRCLLFGLRWPWLSWSRLEDSPRSTSSRNWNSPPSPSSEENSTKPELPTRAALGLGLKAPDGLPGPSRGRTESKEF